MIPVYKGLKLTSDHYYINLSALREHATKSIKLLSNSQLQIDSDHSYTIALDITPLHSTRQAPVYATKRFRISRLTEESIIKHLGELITKRKKIYRQDHLVDVMSTRLVKFYQEIQVKSIGVTPIRKY